MQHMHCLTINLNINNLDLKSPKFVKLETELNEKTQIIKNYEDEFEKINNRQDKLEKLVREILMMRDYRNLTNQYNIIFFVEH